MSLTIRLLDWLNTGIKNIRDKLYAVQLQITTKKLFLKWSCYYLIFYYKIDKQLCGIGSVLQPSWKQNFRSKDQ